MNDPDPPGPGGQFANVLDSLLRPLVRAMIARGVTAPALYTRLKRLYVEVAEESFGLEEKRLTDSRISLLTGVHRRDVRTFRGADTAAQDAVRQRVTTLASVIGRWLADPEFSDSGKPRPLARGADAPSGFDALVRTVNTDIRPKTVLDELERQSLARVEDGLVHLQPDAFLGSRDLDQKAHFFSANVGDHISAAVDNLLADEPPFLERAVFYNRLTSASVDALHQEARDAAIEVLMQLNASAHARQTADMDAEDSVERFRFGMFFYRETESPVFGTGERDDDETD